MMEENSYTGWYSSHRGQNPTFQALVYGREVEPTPDYGEKRGGPDSQKRASSQRVMKEVALLFRFDSKGQTLRDVRVSNISLPVDRDGLPLVWLGLSDQPESIRLLRGQYSGTRATEQKEDLVSAVGMHDAADLVLPFLNEVLASKVDDEIREQAVFWLAETKDPSILSLLERTARGDASEDVREQAVFGISRIETEAADELLISLARKLDDRETREQAIFWLGQKASKKAAANLEDIAENDPDIEIQKKAVFAISQLPEDEGIPRLISIAKTHRNAKVRHEAIFWLGDSGDPRAVDVLVQIVRGR
jgi:HEAT repeat protein